MKNIGDVVIHRKTRRIGKIVGYGHQIVVYQPTLIVRVKGMGLKPEKIVEDLTTAWRQTQSKNPLNLLELLNQG